jgi:xylono-1,5-lactonase
MAPVRAIVTGLTLPEALRADGDGLFFSDAAAGGVHRWSEAGVETVVPKRRGVGGLVPHSEGGIVISGRDLVHVKDGVTRTVFAVEGALGLNDLTTDREGAVYVGSLRMDWAHPEQGRPGEVWRVSQGGDPEAVVEGIQYPNGIGFSPDGSVAYIADYVGAAVHRVEVSERGLVGRRLLATLEAGNADGLAVDSQGCVWVATGKGGSFDCFDPEGRLVDRLRPPASFAVTLCFGGADRRDLYLATADNSAEPRLGGTIFKARSAVAGLPLAAARV